MDETARIQRSKMLSKWLRHKPELGGLTLSKEGWSTFDEILAAFDRAESPTSRPELEFLIRWDPKGRFEVEGERIRARYGHSLELEEKPHPGKPPTTLFHGTPKRYVAKILETGLRPMKRQDVHLSPDKKTGREGGRRRDQEPAILVVDAHGAHETGIQFYPRGKGIWLSDPIPPGFLSVLEDSDEDKAYAATFRSERPSTPGEPRRRRPKGGFAKRAKR